MDDTCEILWRMYQEHCTHGRHHENLRATTANIVLVVAGGALAIVTHGDRPLALEQFPLAMFVILIGLFGALFSAKYYERVCMHTERARKYRDALEVRLPDTAITKLNREADAISKEKFPTLFGLRLHRFWVGLHLLVAALGVLLTVLIVVRNWNDIMGIFHGSAGA